MVNPNRRRVEHGVDRNAHTLHQAGKRRKRHGREHPGSEAPKLIIESLPFPPWMDEQEAIDAGLIDDTPSPTAVYERELLAHA